MILFPKILCNDRLLMIESKIVTKAQTVRTSLSKSSHHLNQLSKLVRIVSLCLITLFVEFTYIYMHLHTLIDSKDSDNMFFLCVIRIVNTVVCFKMFVIALRSYIVD